MTDIKHETQKDKHALMLINSSHHRDDDHLSPEITPQADTNTKSTIG